MTKEDLMKPRYKVIATMPFKPAEWMYNVGDIITDDGKTEVLDKNGNTVFPIEWGDYPHLFKKLQWWEEREDQLPEYIMFSKDYCNFKKGQVFKTENWNKQHDGAGFCIGFITGAGEYDKRAVPASCGLLPATLEEYEQYKQKEATNE